MTSAELKEANTAILKKVAASEIDVDEAQRLIANLEREHGKAAKAALYCKVSVKGGISVYGLQRMPVTLYVGQWERFLEGCPDHFVLVFAREHNSELARK